MTEADAAITEAIERELTPLERAQRMTMLAQPGELSRALRVIERVGALRVAWLVEIWRWVMHLIVVRGYRAATTVATYARTMSGFVEWAVGNAVPHADISLEQFDDWQKWLYIERKNAASYRRRHLIAIRSFYGWRTSRGYGRNCTDGLRGPRKVTKAPKKYTRQQLRDLFTASRRGITPLISQRDETLLLVLLTTGLRREELSTLRIDQVELNDRVGIVRVHGKGAKERMVPIEGPVVQHLIAWLDVRSKIRTLNTDTVFITVRANWLGQTMSHGAIERTVARVAKRANLPSWGVHRFRVTFATQLYDDGVDLERIRILMGHETIETTRRYVVVSDRMNRVRLKSHRQHDALGTRPAGFPRWAQNLEENGNGPVLPSR